MIKDFLKENWKVVGSNEKTLFSELKNISDRTKVRMVEPESLTLYSIVSVVKEGLNVMVIKPEDMYAELLFPIKGNHTYFEKNMKHYGLFPYSRFKSKMGMDDDMLEEIMQAGFFLRYSAGVGDSILLIPSETFFSALCRRLNCGKLPDICDPFLHIFLAYLLRDTDSFKIVYREGELIGKAFTCFSSKYTHITQYDAVADFFASFKSEIPNAFISFFEINHFKTTIRIEMPDLKVKWKKRKIIPCITFTLSDVGDAAFTIQSCLLVNGKCVRIGDPVSQPHKFDTSFEVLVKQYMSRSYPQFKDIVTLLCNLPDKSFPRKDTISTILNCVPFIEACGKNIARLYKENQLDNSLASLEDIIFELLNIPGSIEHFYYRTTLEKAIKFNKDLTAGKETGKYKEEVGKQIAPSILEKMETAIGQIFTNVKVKELIQW